MRTVEVAGNRLLLTITHTLFVGAWRTNRRSSEFGIVAKPRVAPSQAPRDEEGRRSPRRRSARTRAVAQPWKRRRVQRGRVSSYGGLPWHPNG